MSWLQSLLLGFIQGITEFFPVSSSGHIVIFGQMLQVPHNSLSFIILLHGATLLSIFTVFFKDLKPFVFSFYKAKSMTLIFKILLSTLPLVFVGLFLKSFIEQTFNNKIVALGFLMTGVLLLSLIFKKKRVPFNKEGSLLLELENLSFIKAFTIGLFQCIAILPGFSRSGWTTVPAVYMGLSQSAAVFYSFLIAIPAILGALLLEVFQNSSSFEFSLNLCLAFISAYLSGIFALFLIVKLVQKQRFYIFAFYLLPLSFYLIF